MKGRYGDQTRNHASRRFYPEAVAIIALVAAAWAGALFAVA